MDVREENERDARKDEEYFDRRDAATENTITLHSGAVLTGVHGADECFLPNCCIHNPSDHPLKDAPMEWWGQFRHMVRVCEHGYNHPDPDDLAFKSARWETLTVEAICSVHLMQENCDGCCQRKATR